MQTERITKINTRDKQELSAFYERAKLRPDMEWDMLILLRENGIAAAGYRKGRVLMGLAVAPAFQGENLAGRVVTELVQEAARQGITHLFLFTKPENRMLFTNLGFSVLAGTESALMMENRRSGIERFLQRIPRVEAAKTGCIVAHANPFTRGHLALVQKAAAECDFVYLFILSEKTEPFTPAQRLSMARDAVSALPNVLALPGGDYMVSYATFPDYFYPDKAYGRKANCELDLTLFAERIAPALGITDRYVGTEPYSEVTAEYNEAMERILPAHGIRVHRMERASADGEIISASKVREALQKGDYARVCELCPRSTVDALAAAGFIKEDTRKNTEN